MPKAAFKELSRSKSGARSGILNTRAGKVLTPFFMPVATRGAVKGLEPAQVVDTGAQVLLANTYHLHLSPGEKTVKKLGGLHKFSGWQGPLLTDSGGFQVFSLAKVRKITEDGVTFKDPKTGDKIFISPEISMQIQLALGADIIMAFDDLTGLDDQARERTHDAVERTHRWLERCVAEFKRLTKDMDTTGAIQADARQGAGEQQTEVYEKYSEGAAQPATKHGAASASGAAGSAGRQASAVNASQPPLLFGIVQGGLNKTLRKKSLEFVQSQDVGGVAIGGLSVGESRQEMHGMLDFLAPQYDPSKIRYIMGIGDPIDARYSIEHGLDMMDCVMPTRNARHGTVWIDDNKRLNLTNAQFAADPKPIDPKCDCHTCKAGYSRAYLRQLYKSENPLAGSLASLHNLRYLARIFEEYR